MTQSLSTPIDPVPPASLPLTTPTAHISSQPTSPPINPTPNITAPPPIPGALNPIAVPHDEQGQDMAVATANVERLQQQLQAAMAERDMLAKK